MVNAIWMVLIVGGVVVAGATGEIETVTEALMTSAQLGIETVLGFIGIMIMWMGMMRIAQESGLIELMSRAMRPLVRRIMPEVPPEHPAMGALLMNISANLLGVGHAATPLGLKAMQELQKLNDEPETATNAMCTFLALNTSSVTLIPATVIAFRANAGSANPTEIVATTLMATLCSTIAALTLDYLFRRRQRR
jgi:spore maturation protein A